MKKLNQKKIREFFIKLDIALAFAVVMGIIYTIIK